MPLLGRLFGVFPRRSVRHWHWHADHADKRRAAEGYTFGRHSWRHLIGGRIECFTCDGTVSPRYRLWKGASWLNERHMTLRDSAASGLAFTDFYNSLVSTGTKTRSEYLVTHYNVHGLLHVAVTFETSPVGGMSL